MRGSRVRVVVGCVIAGLMHQPGAAEASPKTLARLAEQLEQTLQVYQQADQQMRPYDVMLRRDPLEPLLDDEGRLLSSTGLHGGLSVQGIIWSPDNPLLVVDDELLKIGDTLGPYKILEIYTDGVIVQHEDHTLFIPLDRGLETPSEHQVELIQKPVVEEAPAPAVDEPPVAAPADPAAPRSGIFLRIIGSSAPPVPADELAPESISLDTPMLTVEMLPPITLPIAFSVHAPADISFRSTDQSS